jgi:hypothetical protein
MITEQDTAFNQGWVSFDTSNETTAYAVITNYLVSPDEEDLRALYYECMGSAATWLGELDDTVKMQGIANNIASACDNNCFTTVSEQLKEEVNTLSELNVWIESFKNYVQDTFNDDMQTSLGDARATISISSTQQVHPSSGIPSWLGPILQVLTLAQGIAGPLGVLLPMANLLKITS